MKGSFAYHVMFIVGAVGLAYVAWIALPNAAARNPSVAEDCRKRAKYLKRYALIFLIAGIVLLMLDFFTG